MTEQVIPWELEKILSRNEQLALEMQKVTRIQKHVARIVEISGARFFSLWYDNFVATECSNIKWNKWNTVKIAKLVKFEDPVYVTLWIIYSNFV